MNKLAALDINAFRAAQDLSSTSTAQLRRTIADLEARVQEQDTLIALQNEEIQNQASRLEEKEAELHEIQTARSNPDQGLYDIPKGFKYTLEKEKLERANKNMEALIEEFEDGFWTLFTEQRQGLDECLIALEQLPATPETKSLYARVKKEWQAIEAAKKRNIITPVNALRQLADLERAAVTFILDRPMLTLTTIETFRAEVLLEAFVTDLKLKQLTTNDSIRTISSKEEKKIYREQALRAMRRAARMFPDKVNFEMKGRIARLIKMEDGPGKNMALRCVITICYMIQAGHNLLQSIIDLPDDVIYTLGGIFRDIISI